MVESARIAGRGDGAVWEFALPRGRRLRVDRKPIVAGIINATPDSFSDGGDNARSQDAVESGLRMLAEGADWLDVGGESTRPGSLPVPAAEQLRRVLPVISGLRARSDAPISVDTMSSEVGRAALEAGADIVNDVSGFRDPGWQSVLAGRPAPVVLMHMQGTPLDMQANPQYPEGVTAAVYRFFQERLALLAQWGVGSDRVFLDPGIGFGKRLQDNLELIRNIEVFQNLGRPIFIGASRKGFIDKVLGHQAKDRDLGTVLLNAVAIFKGARILRVHNVAYARALVAMVMAVEGAAS